MVSLFLPKFSGSSITAVWLILSNHFKKKTGLTPTHFKNLKLKECNALGDV